MRKASKDSKPVFTKRTVSTVEEIGAVIRQVRKENNLTQEQAATLCKVNPRFLGELENGKEKDFKMRLVLQVINSFGIVLELQRRRL